VLYDIQDEKQLGFNLSEPGQMSYPDLMERFVLEGRFTKPDPQELREKELKETPALVAAESVIVASHIDVTGGSVFLIEDDSPGSATDSVDEARQQRNGRI
ncbi:hypothetical protein HDU93_003049, partial [Gonapodya sp. JEL0774]